MILSMHSGTQQLYSERKQNIDLTGATYIVAEHTVRELTWTFQL